MGFALSPILQCQSGHIVCVSCCTKLSSCPTCRGTPANSRVHLPSHLEDIHNLAMEELAASILFTCMSTLTGCTETLHYTVKAEHESVWEHRLHLKAPARLLTWETKPWNIRHGAEVAIAVYDCLIFDSKTARHC
ncbi:E3 ubiquitin-protein ligase sina [Taenia solium]|eukprot:TsM_000225500 transcript=TsM_000225500 gene=TsM_000225500